MPLFADHEQMQHAGFVWRGPDYALSRLIDACPAVEFDHGCRVALDPEGYATTARTASVTLIRGGKPLRKELKREVRDIVGQGPVAVWTNGEEYPRLTEFQVATAEARSLEGMAQLWKAIRWNPGFAIVRGRPRGHKPWCEPHNRRVKGPDADFEDCPSLWIFGDVDGVPIPDHFDPVADVEAIAEWLAFEYLPEPFRGVSCVWSPSASHGFKAGARLHLAWLADAPIYSADLASLFQDRREHWNLDPAVNRATQPFYLSRPKLTDSATGRSLTDPLEKAGGVLYGARDYLPLKVLIDRRAEEQRFTAVIRQATASSGRTYTGSGSTRGLRDRFAEILAEARTDQNFRNPIYRCLCSAAGRRIAWASFPIAILAEVVWSRADEVGCSAAYRETIGGYLSPEVLEEQYRSAVEYVTTQPSVH